MKFFLWSSVLLGCLLLGFVLGARVALQTSQANNFNAALAGPGPFEQQALAISNQIASGAELRRLDADYAAWSNRVTQEYAP